MFDFLLRLVVDFWATVGEMPPYLLFGFLVAGLLSVFAIFRPPAALVTGLVGGI